MQNHPSKPYLNSPTWIPPVNLKKNGSSENEVYNPYKKITDYTWRFRLVLILILILFFALIARLLDLALFNRSFLQKQGNARTLRTVDIPAYRGMILDRNGTPLAVSTLVYSVWIDPQSFQPSHEQFFELSKLLGIHSNRLAKQIQTNKEKEFLYLARAIKPELAQTIKKLNIEGLFLRESYKRFYPNSEVDAQLLGRTNIDDEGQEGLELAYNSTLQGLPGLQQVIKDRFGHVVQALGTIQKAKPGRNIILSIDQRLQYIAYKNLSEGVQNFDAQGGSVVLLDIKTGEILAMANAPSFNPNTPFNKIEASHRNRAVTDRFEPGSTAKVFPVYLALESKKYTPNTLFYTAPGWTRIGKHRVQDTSNHGTITLTQVLQYSSNIGVSRIALSLSDPQLLWKLLKKVGFGSSTYSGFPGEVSGELTYRSIWDPFVLATLSFGYGFSITTLQLAQAYAILANEGKQVPISLLKLMVPPPVTPVLNPKICQQLIRMMKSVIEEGTGKQAKVPGYIVSGKTGTTRIVGSKGYQLNHHNAMFVLIAPATHPRLVIAVYINDPKKHSYYGGTVAGSISSKIMFESLQALNITPDDPDL